MATSDISPAVLAACERFGAANDLVLEHVNAFLDLSPTWSLMRAALAGHLHLVQRLSRRSPNKFQRCCQEAMDSAAEFGHLDVVLWLHENRLEGCTTDAMDMAASNGHLEIVQWLHDNRTEGCKMGFVEYLSRRGFWDVAALTDKYPFLQELVDAAMFTDEEDDQVLEMEDMDFLRLWNIGTHLQQQ
ncbi:hypothetical protein PRIC1_013919 [Phytophthora ramorum]